MPFPYSFASAFAPDGPPPPSGADAYLRQLKQLLPRGLFLLDPGSLLPGLLEGTAYELARVDGRGADLVEESDPRTATETLPEWERMLGLPDTAVTEIPDTDEERRLAITQKLIRQGGQSRDYFVALAAACGYTVTIDDSFGGLLLWAGFPAGADCYGDAWAHVWRLDVQAPTGPALSHAEIESIIRRAAPAHTLALFNYL